MSEGADPKAPVEVSREELYRQVWDTPMSRLASQYGISGNGLAKICDRLKVPYPPRGYWAKKAAGRRVIAYRLPHPGEDTPLHAKITATPLPKKVPEPPQEVKARLDEARAASTPVVVPERLLRPHAIIARWLADHDRRKQEARRSRDPWMRSFVTDFTETDHRRHRVLDALFKAVERQGGKATEGDRRELYVEMMGEKVEFQLREKQKQVRRPLNDSEKRWASKDDKGWRQELQPTGRFVFSIRTYLPGNLKREWTETQETPLESFLPDIVARFVAAGPLLAEQTRQRQEAERKRQAAEQRRYEEQQRRKLDDNRWRRFVELAQQRRDAETARTFLEALKVASIDVKQEIAGAAIADWIAWAEERLIRMDPLSHGVDAIFETIATVTAWSYRD